MGCNNSTSSNVDYCDAHKRKKVCAWELYNCSKSRKDGSRYCTSEHACPRDQCENGKAPKMTFCERHACQGRQGQCQNEKSSSVSFCSDHACKKTDCPEENYSKGYCKAHGHKPTSKWQVGQKVRISSTYPGYKKLKEIRDLRDDKDIDGTIRRVGSTSATVAVCIGVNTDDSGIY